MMINLSRWTASVLLLLAAATVRPVGAQIRPPVPLPDPPSKGDILLFRKEHRTACSGSGEKPPLGVDRECKGEELPLEYWQLVYLKKMAEDLAGIATLNSKPLQTMLDEKFETYRKDSLELQKKIVQLFDEIPAAILKNEDFKNHLEKLKQDVIAKVKESEPIPPPPSESVKKP